MYEGIDSQLTMWPECLSPLPSPDEEPSPSTLGGDLREIPEMLVVPG